MSIVAQPTILERLALPSKLKPAIEQRIEKLGRLNDRVVKARGAGDRMSLLDLADEYDRLKCPRMGSQIRTEAMLLQS